MSLAPFAGWTRPVLAQQLDATNTTWHAIAAAVDVCTARGHMTCSADTAYYQITLHTCYDDAARFAELVLESFVLFADPYHKQLYQLPSGDDVVRGVAMPTDVQFPVSVDVSADQGLVYWIDSGARSIVSSHFTDDRHTVLANLPPGAY